MNWNPTLYGRSSQRISQPCLITVDYRRVDGPRIGYIEFRSKICLLPPYLTNCRISRHGLTIFIPSHCFQPIQCLLVPILPTWPHLPGFAASRCRQRGEDTEKKLIAFRTTSLVENSPNLCFSKQKHRGVNGFQLPIFLSRAGKRRGKERLREWSKKSTRKWWPMLCLGGEEPTHAIGRFSENKTHMAIKSPGVVNESTVNAGFSIANFICLPASFSISTSVLWSLVLSWMFL